MCSTSQVCTSYKICLRRMWPQGYGRASSLMDSDHRWTYRIISVLQRSSDAGWVAMIMTCSHCLASRKIANTQLHHKHNHCTRDTTDSNLLAGPKMCTVHKSDYKRIAPLHNR